MSHTKNINTIKIGNIKLPGGLAGPYIFSRICQYLDIKSLLNFIETSLIKKLTEEFRSDDFEKKINEYIEPASSLYLLIERYKREFPRGTVRRDEIPTPIVCACEHGRMDDVQSFMNLHHFHKYITNRDMSGYRDDMTLKDMLSQFGTDSEGYEYTPLMMAARYEHFQIVKYLIEQGEADPNIANSSDGYNALLLAAWYNRTSTELIQLLLTHMTLDSINKKTSEGDTPLDYAYLYNDSPICQEIIALLRSQGGKANCFDENGIYIGDLND